MGKTHLAVVLGVKAAEHGFSSQFYRFDELKVTLKAEAHFPPARLRRRKYLPTSLLIIDELGFEPMSRAMVSWSVAKGGLPDDAAKLHLVRLLEVRSALRLIADRYQSLILEHRLNELS